MKFTTHRLAVVAITCFMAACGSRSANIMNDMPLPQALFGPDEPEFQALVARAAATPSSEGGACEDLRAALEKEIRRLSENLPYVTLVQTLAFSDAVNAYKVFKGSGCKGPGEVDEPLSGHCKAMVESVDNNWGAVKTEPQYVTLRADGSLNPMLAAWTAARDGNCYH